MIKDYRLKIELCNLLRAEVQRIESVPPLAVSHSTTRDTSLVGFLIPRDMTVFVNLWAIHFDYWEDPFCFRPARFLDEQGRLCLKGYILRLSHLENALVRDSLSPGKQFSCTLLDCCTDFNLRVHLVPYSLYQCCVYFSLQPGSPYGLFAFEWRAVKRWWGEGAPPPPLPPLSFERVPFESK